MSRSFYDAFPNASSSSNEDEVPSAEADIKFQVSSKFHFEFSQDFSRSRRKNEGSRKYSSLRLRNQ